MPVSLYISPAASGKTAYLVARARDLARDARAAPRVVVPTRLQVRAWKQRLAESGGALGVRVSTFDTLYRDVLGAAGETVIQLSEPIQYRLLRSLIVEAKLDHYAPLRAMPGFVQAVLDLIREFKAGGVFPEHLAAAVATMGNEPRLAELAQLYTAYQVRLQERGWADFAGVGWLAAEALERHPDLGRRWPALFVDGFDDLTTVQRRVLGLLAGRVAELTLTLTGSPDGDERAAVHKRFNRTRQVLETDWDAKAQPLPPVDIPPAAPALAHLEATFLSGETSGQPAGDALVAHPPTMIAAPDREGEVRAALRWLKQRAIHDGLRLGELALIARRCDPYLPFIMQIAKEFGLPLHVAAGLPLRQNPAVTALLDLLRLGPPEAPFPWRLTVEAWRSPYFDWANCLVGGAPLGITAQAAESLEQVARWGCVIQGVDQWTEALARLGDTGRSEDLGDTGMSAPNLPTGTAAEALRDRFARFVQRVTPPVGPRPCRAFVAWLEGLIGDLAVAEEGPPTDVGVMRCIQDGPPALAERDMAALNAFKDVLRGLVWAEEAVTRAPAGFADFYADLVGAVETAVYRLPLPADAQALLVADVTQARGLAFRAVAVLGLAEGEFPATLAEDPLLRDADRRRLRDEFDLALELSTDSTEAEYAYEALTRASAALLLTRPRIADNGALWQASPYWEEVRRRVRVEPLLLTGRQQPAPAAAASWPELLLSVAAQGDSVAPWAWAQTIAPERTTYVQSAADILSVRAQPAPASAHEGDLTAWATTWAQRFGPERVWSASRLETYRTCPFFFWVSHVLRLEARPLPTEGLDARQLGNIYHHIFERLYKTVADPADLEALLAALPPVVAEILDAAPRREQFRPTAWWAQTRAEIEENVRRSLVALAELADDFVPYAHEAAFGIGDRPPLVVQEGEDVFRLRGLIDRVERTPDGRLRIIDYKTAGKSAFDKRAVADGKKLQLPLYALAAQVALALGTVIDGFYWHVRQAEHSDFTLAKFDGGPQGAMDVALRHAWEAVQGARAGRFAPQPPADGCPGYCPAGVFCWRYKGRAWQGR
ncbi:MAG: PD-(D/E)XK nuclease family protein [Anaerolineae bacterium]|nr:PD-(D/E)XK nuclease family protein [Anaerolineae bacterium]